MLRNSLGTTSSGSNSSFSPSPSQAGQAPCGALKLNSLGSISAMVKPETGQANFSEKVIRPGGALSERTARVSPSPSGEGLGWGLFSGPVDRTSPTPGPSPEGEGGASAGSR